MAHPDAGRDGRTDPQEDKAERPWVGVTPRPHTAGMERQLPLISSGSSRWKLDERTKEIGRRGIAEARKAMQDAARRAAEQRKTAA